MKSGTPTIDMPEGSSEQFRRDLHPAAPGFHELVAGAPAPRLDGVDIYHGNTITDETVIPAFQLGVHKISEGANFLDAAAAARLAMFARRGIIRRGGYHWLRSDASIGAQWANFCRGLQASGLLDASGALIDGAFVMLDFETTYKTATTTIPDPSPQMAVDWCGLVAHQFGDRHTVYSADWFAPFAAWRAACPDLPLWYAAYNVAAGAAKCARYNATCWQFTSTARVPGFAAGVDGNTILRADVFDRICGLTTEPLAPPVAPPVPPVVITPTPPVAAPIVQPPIHAPFPTPQGDEMPIVTNAETLFDSPPGEAKFVLNDDGKLRHITLIEWQTRGSQPGAPWTNADISPRLLADT